MLNKLYVILFYFKSFYKIKFKGYMSDLFSLLIIVGIPVLIYISFSDFDLKSTMTIDNFILDISIITMIILLLLHKEVIYASVFNLRFFIYNLFFMQKIYNIFIKETSNFLNVYKCDYIKQNSKELIKLVFEKINYKFLTNFKNIHYKDMVKLNVNLVKNLEDEKSLFNYYNDIFIKRNEFSENLDYAVYEKVVYNKKIHDQKVKDTLFMYINYIIRVWISTMDKFIRPRLNNIPL